MQFNSLEIYVLELSLLLLFPNKKELMDFYYKDNFFMILVFKRIRLLFHSMHKEISSDFTLYKRFIL